MLKKDITYTDFDGVEQTDTFYFNLSKAELVRMQAQSEGEALEDRLTRIVKSKNNALIVAEFEKFILSSYGIRSEDNKRFVKSDEISRDFQQSAAYDELLFSFFTGDDAGSDFINGIMPKGLMDEVNTELAAGKSPSDIARGRSEANMQGHLTKTDPRVSADENATLDAQDEAAVEFAKEERRRALQAQLDELNS